MPNVLSTDKQVTVISALAEGSGIRQIERLNGTTRLHMRRLPRPAVRAAILQDYRNAQEA